MVNDEILELRRKQKEEEKELKQNKSFFKINKSNTILESEKLEKTISGERQKELNIEVDNVLEDEIILNNKTENKIKNLETERDKIIADRKKEYNDAVIQAYQDFEDIKKELKETLDENLSDARPSEIKEYTDEYKTELQEAKDTLEEELREAKEEYDNDIESENKYYNNEIQNLKDESEDDKSEYNSQYTSNFVPITVGLIGIGFVIIITSIVLNEIGPQILNNSDIQNASFITITNFIEFMNPIIFIISLPFFIIIFNKITRRSFD